MSVIDYMQSVGTIIVLLVLVMALAYMIGIIFTLLRLIPYIIAIIFVYIINIITSIF